MILRRYYLFQAFMVWWSKVCHRSDNYRILVFEECLIVGDFLVPLSNVFLDLDFAVFEGHGVFD